mmetsp:Transcript_32300/g.108814  ORF Transcript_32300/g.108814 Transcript_32300/m.108814 type:complete len:270 (+) Transcript_32300:700-1509(+)
MSSRWKLTTPRPSPSRACRASASGSGASRSQSASSGGCCPGTRGERPNAASGSSTSTTTCASSRTSTANSSSTRGPSSRGSKLNADAAARARAQMDATLIEWRMRSGEVEGGSGMRFRERGSAWPHASRALLTKVMSAPRPLRGPESRVETSAASNDCLGARARDCHLGAAPPSSDDDSDVPVVACLKSSSPTGSHHWISSGLLELVVLALADRRRVVISPPCRIASSYVRICSSPGRGAAQSNIKAKGEAAACGALAAVRCFGGARGA